MLPNHITPRTIKVIASALLDLPPCDESAQNSAESLRALAEAIRKHAQIIVDEDENVVPQEPMSVSTLNLNADIVFILGGPGSGKGTICTRLVSEFKFLHLSVGDLLRSEVASGSAVGQEVEGIMKSGGLISDRLALSIVRESIEKARSMTDSGPFRVLLDGFPRTLDQAMMFESSVCRVSRIVWLTCSDEILVERILARGLTSGRQDDNAESVRTRLKAFNENTEKIREHFANLNDDRLVVLDASLNSEEVYDKMLALYPKGEFETAQDLSRLSQVTLVHPRTESLCKFFIDKEKIRLYEVQTVTRGTQSNGSFLVEPDKLVHRTDLTIHSQIDPFFILLPYMMTLCSPEAQFIDFIDCMNSVIEKSRSDNEKDGLVDLIQTLDRSSNYRELFCNTFCETRNVMDRIMVRISKARVIDWLRGKIDLVDSLLGANTAYLVEIAQNPNDLSKFFALELIGTYISQEVLFELVRELGYDADSVFGDKTQVEAENAHPGNGSDPPNSAVKRPSVSVVQQPSVKKQKEAAIAKSCMKMTSFFKPKA